MRSRCVPVGRASDHEKHQVGQAPPEKENPAEVSPNTIGRASKNQKNASGEANEYYTEQAIAVIWKNRRDQVRVSRKVWRGFDLVDLREFVPAAASGEMVATRRGLCLRLEVAEQLADALLKACQGPKRGGHA